MESSIDQTEESLSRGSRRCLGGSAENELYSMIDRKTAGSSVFLLLPRRLRSTTCQGTRRISSQALPEEKKGPSVSGGKKPLRFPCVDYHCRDRGGAHSPHPAVDRTPRPSIFLPRRTHRLEMETLPSELTVSRPPCLQLRGRPLPARSWV